MLNKTISFFKSFFIFNSDFCKNLNKPIEEHYIKTELEKWKSDMYTHSTFLTYIPQSRIDNQINIIKAEYKKKI
jgi:hypothetical protein